MISGPTRCPICHCTIKPGLLMCATHWSLVPLHLRTRILGLFRTEPGGDAHRSACVEAVHCVLRLLNPSTPPPPRAA